VYGIDGAKKRPRRVFERSVSPDASRTAVKHHDKEIRLSRESGSQATAARRRRDGREIENGGRPKPRFADERPRIAVASRGASKSVQHRASVVIGA
jgi:hypothetical protein